MKNFMTLIMFAFISLGFMSGCAADPADICDHMAELGKKEAKIETSDADLKECVKSIESSKEMQGYFKYRTRSRCVMDAEKLADIEKCDKE